MILRSNIGHNVPDHKLSGHKVPGQKINKIAALDIKSLSKSLYKTDYYSARLIALNYNKGNQKLDGPKKKIKLFSLHHFADLWRKCCNCHVFVSLYHKMLTSYSHFDGNNIQLHKISNAGNKFYCFTKTLKNI